MLHRIPIELLRHSPAKTVKRKQLLGLASNDDDGNVWCCENANLFQN